MSDCMIIRRGRFANGGGFSHDAAVLKVVTSTGCTINVSGTGYSETQEPADGYVRGGDSAVTEHLFSIPASALGTIRATASKVYTNGGVTDTLTTYKDITIGTAGKVYEVLIAAPNIILDNTFGLQNGFGFSSGSEYDSIRKEYKLYAAQNTRNTYTLYNNLSGVVNPEISLIPFSQVEITLSTVNVFGGIVELKGSDNTVVHSESLGASGATTRSITVNLSDEDKAFDPFTLRFTLNAYGSHQSSGIVTTITRLVFS